ncbi:MAG: 4-hydroxy-tetrahydrodipicolinate reductase [Bacteroidales bacterium]|nr:4-hydroxy-tetrahydrodipicolinate reductase [Bacteroidales bacterium]
MKIALLGYGKMGKEIEKIAIARNHEIVLKIDIDNTEDGTVENIAKANVAIDFSVPASAYNNIMLCFNANVPIVCGTTGWLDKFENVVEYCRKNNQTFFYAPNYSIGVNIFFRLNRYLANLMDKFENYNVELKETHHIHKIDAPSGTALELAGDLLKFINRKTEWKLNEVNDESELKIETIREGEVPGIHEIKYESKVDTIEIKHSAKNRIGLATGAILAAEFIQHKKGYFNMDHLMDAH